MIVKVQQMKKVLGGGVYQVSTEKTQAEKKHNKVLILANLCPEKKSWTIKKVEKN